SARTPGATDVAPGFTHSDATSTPRRLAYLCAEQSLLLVFYRDRTVRFRSLDRTARRVELEVLFTFLRRCIASSPRPFRRDQASSRAHAIDRGSRATCSGMGFAR